jgi:hypothetical protein
MHIHSFLTSARDELIGQLYATATVLLVKAARAGVGVAYNLIAIPPSSSP